MAGRLYKCPHCGKLVTMPVIIRHRKEVEWRREADDDPQKQTSKHVISLHRRCVYCGREFFDKPVCPSCHR